MQLNRSIRSIDRFLSVLRAVASGAHEAFARSSLGGPWAPATVPIPAARRRAGRAAAGAGRPVRPFRYTLEEIGGGRPFRGSGPGRHAA